MVFGAITLDEIVKAVSVDREVHRLSPETATLRGQGEIVDSEMREKEGPVKCEQKLHVSHLMKLSASPLFFCYGIQ